MGEPVFMADPFAARPFRFSAGTGALPDGSASYPCRCIAGRFRRNRGGVLPVAPCGISLEIVAVAKEGVEFDAIGFGDDFGVPVQEDADGGVGGGPVFVTQIHPIRVIGIF